MPLFVCRSKHGMAAKILKLTPMTGRDARPTKTEQSPESRAERGTRQSLGTKGKSQNSLHSAGAWSSSRTGTLLAGKPDKPLLIGP
jgi:hypothetical protein